MIGQIIAGGNASDLKTLIEVLNDESKRSAALEMLARMEAANIEAHSTLAKIEVDSRRLEQLAAAGLAKEAEMVAKGAELAARAEELSRAKADVDAASADLTAREQALIESQAALTKKAAAFVKEAEAKTAAYDAKARALEEAEANAQALRAEYEDKLLKLKQVMGA